MTSGVIPSHLRCSIARSASQDAVKPRTSYRNDAVGANNWKSPVQPSRSSRCGQSLGMDRKLPRMLHNTLSCNRFSCGCDDDQLPVRLMSLWQTTAVSVVDRVRTTGPAVHLDVAESVEGEQRLPHLTPVPRQGVFIGGLGQPQRPQREFAVHVEYLGMPQGHDVARRTGDGRFAPDPRCSARNPARGARSGSGRTGPVPIVSIRRTGSEMAGARTSTIQRNHGDRHQIGDRRPHGMTSRRSRGAHRAVRRRRCRSARSARSGWRASRASVAMTSVVPSS